MNLRVVILDEMIHVDDPRACELWQRCLWAKEKGYRAHYKSGILPLSVDDFIATHLIVADERPNGDLIPVVMSKSIRRSQAQRFSIPFGAELVTKGTVAEKDSELIKILMDPREISYESSWTVNPEYRHYEGLSKTLRNYMTMLACRYPQEFKIPRWITAGVTKFKIDTYFEWMGGCSVGPEFSLPIIDGQTVRLIYIPQALSPRDEVQQVANSMSEAWDSKLYFGPQSSVLLFPTKGAKDEVRAA